jgi:aminoglycoside phosphotransferase (APT) family kinase protein
MGAVSEQLYDADVVSPLPSAGALSDVRRLAGPSAEIASVVNLVGGQHAMTWRVQTVAPERTMVVREFPPGDTAAGNDARVLRLLDGLNGICPVVLSCDLERRWSERPTVITSWIDGQADITPGDPDGSAEKLGRALAKVHAFPADASSLTSVFERRGGSLEVLAGPAASYVRWNWSQVLAAPEALLHEDYWSGNTVWRAGELTGIVDWSGAGRGPRGFDLGWCRLDLFLLFDERVADVFLAAYEDATDERIDASLWDAWALARSHQIVASWTPNYRPLGRPDLDREALRHRHHLWTTRVLEHS